MRRFVCCALGSCNVFKRLRPLSRQLSLQRLSCGVCVSLCRCRCLALRSHLPKQFGFSL